MSNANPSLPRPPSYYFQPVKVESEPVEPVKVEPEPVQEVPLTRPDFFEPLAKRFLRQHMPTTPRPSTPPPTPMLSRQQSRATQTPMAERWLLDPMP